MSDTAFYIVGVLEAALIVAMLWALARYDRDHPVQP